MKSIRNAFLTGLILLLPMGVTVFTVTLLLNKIGTPLSDWFFWFLPDSISQEPFFHFLLSLASVVIVAVLITLLGYLSRYFIGRFVVKLTERFINRVPFVSSVYGTVKQIVETLSKQSASVFSKVVLVEFPRKGVYSIGFETSRAGGEVQLKTKEEVVNVFIPTTPNPTSGFFVMVPRAEVFPLEMSVGDGMKLIISGGALVPDYPTAPKTQLDAPEATPAGIPH